MRPSTKPLPTGDAKAVAVRDMFDRIAGRYDLLNRILTFRLDVRWRRTAVARLGAGPGALVLDLACGTGDLCRELEAAGMHAIGVDFSAGMLSRARTVVPLVQADVLRLPFADASADAAVSGFALRNVIDLEAFVRESARVVRRGGRIALLDVSEPAHAPMRWGHGIWFRHVVPFIGGLLSDGEAYRYLPASTAYLPRSAELVALVRRAGFPDAVRVPLSGGITQLLLGTRA